MPQLGSFEKALRVGEGRRLKRLREQADYIMSLEPEFDDLSDDQLAAKTVEIGLEGKDVVRLLAQTLQAAAFTDAQCFLERAQLRHGVSSVAGEA